MKIVFFGTPEFAVPVLGALIAGGYEVLAVTTQPDKPVGRNRDISWPPTKLFADKNNISVLQPKSLKDDAFFNEFKNLNPDICIVAAYGKIIPERYLLVPRYGFLCVHPSLLPKYRGPSPIQGAILDGNTETGITIIIIDKDMDHGSILSTKKYALGKTMYLKEAEKNIWDLGTKLLIETLPKYISGEIKPQEQDHDQATFTKMLKREDGKINWCQSAEKIYNQIRALSEEPGTWTTWNNKILNIRQANHLEAQPLPEVKPQVAKPGTIISIDGQVAVATDKCYLILKTVQLEGKKETDVKSFVNGYPDFINSKFE